MFEKLIEGLLLQYFGDYIENLDPNKLQLGVSIMKTLMFIIAFIWKFIFN